MFCWLAKLCPYNPKKTPIDEVLETDVRRNELLDTCASLEEELRALANGDPAAFSNIHGELLEAQTMLLQWGGVQEEVSDLLAGLGFQRSGTSGGFAGVPTLETPLLKLSGGWRMKVHLAKAFWLRPKLLLLDEPTNHLDFQALSWLEEKVLKYPHTTIVVSHDADFLHRICHDIIWIKDQKLERIPRNMVSPYELAQMQRRQPLRFEFSVPDGPNEDHGVSFHGVEFKFPVPGAKEVGLSFKSRGDLRITGKSRTLLLGRNGSGKTTFLNLCVGRLNPTAGAVDRTVDCKIGYYTQHDDELHSYLDDSAAACLVQACHDTLAARTGAQSAGLRRRARESVAYEKHLVQAACNILRNFGLEGDAASSLQVRDLSGGQKARLKLAILSLHPAHLLILDEPTNHLDCEGVEALSKGLSEFDGGVLVVSHDESLIVPLFLSDWQACQLLICQDGCVFRQASSGSYCLKAFKEHIRKVETGAPGKDQPIVSSGEHAGRGPSKANRSRSRGRPSKCSTEVQQSTSEQFLVGSRSKPEDCVSQPSTGGFDKVTQNGSNQQKSGEGSQHRNRSRNKFSVLISDDGSPPPMIESDKCIATRGPPNVESVQVAINNTPGNGKKCGLAEDNMHMGGRDKPSGAVESSPSCNEPTGVHLPSRACASSSTLSHDVDEESSWQVVMPRKQKKKGRRANSVPV